jgi:putative ABC transport system substrate-binding protein
VEGKSIVVEHRFADNHLDRLSEIAFELVQQKADVIVTLGTLAPLAAKHATTTIPIVMVSAGDPIRSGIITSLSRPGGNITGTSLNAPEVAAKRLQLLKEAVPSMFTVAVLWNAENPYSSVVFAETKIAAQSVGMRVLSAGVRETGDVAHSLDMIQRDGADGLIVVEDPLTASGEHQRIVKFAERMRLPSIFGFSALVASGGLFSYGANLDALWRRGAWYVDRILKGANPGDLPVELPTRYEFVINLKTARAIGLTVPRSLLLRADDVIS